MLIIHDRAPLNLPIPTLVRGVAELTVVLVLHFIPSNPHGGESNGAALPLGHAMAELLIFISGSAR